MRLFLAVDVPEEIRREIENRLAPLRPGLPKARWVRPASLHLTLVFLGDTAVESLPALRRAATRACADRRSMILRWGGLGAFPPRGPARVLWLALDGGEALAELQLGLAEGTSLALGLEPEGRPFRPHLTLARCRSPWPRPKVEELEAGFGPAPLPEFECAEVRLFESRLKPSGAEYRTVEVFPLGAAA